MALFPMCVKLCDRLCVVVGGGAIAESKIRSLLDSEASVRVVAPSVTDTIAGWMNDSRVELRLKSFTPDDLAGAFLVVAATSSAEVNSQIFREAEARKILCNAVDQPEQCHFYYPAVVRRGSLQIAISTEGLSPALAQRLRQELETQFGPEYGVWLEWLGEVRQFVRAGAHPAAETKEFLHFLASREMFDQFLRETERPPAEGSAH
jgi:precorrin-2 dehydrogenase / sirohydrochlorin ferrochelatase